MPILLKKKTECSIYWSIFFSTFCCDFFQILGFIYSLSGEYHCTMDEEENLMGSSYDFVVKEQ